MSSIADRQRYPRFSEGQMIILTSAAQRKGMQGRALSPRGIVVETDGRMRVRVRRHGLVTPDWFWAGFWRPLTKREVGDLG